MTIPPSLVTTHANLVGEAVNATDINDIARAINNLRIINVRDYLAAGDGTTDDTTAIQSALNAVSGNGGVVYFPPGDYRVSAPLTIKSGTKVLGSMPQSHYAGGAVSLDPATPCQIRLTAGFSGGTALFTPAGTVRAVSFENIALIGSGVSGVNCFKFVEWSSWPGPQGWWFRDCLFQGFNCVIAGTLNVFEFVNCIFFLNSTYHIDSNIGTNNRLIDGKFIGCWFAYGTSGNIRLGGSSSGMNGGLDFIGCRFERAGNTYGSPLSNANTDAAGIKISHAHQINLVSCNTDGNSGDGIFITVDSSAQLVSGINIIGCYTGRDGGTNQVTLADRAGIRLVGLDAAHPVQRVNIIGHNQVKGKADDGGGGIDSPKYGLIVDYLLDSQVQGGYFEGATATQDFLVGAGGTGQIYRCDINVPHLGLMTIPVRSGAPTNFLADGSTERTQLYLDSADTKLTVRFAGAWKKTAALA